MKTINFKIIHSVALLLIVAALLPAQETIVFTGTVTNDVLKEYVSGASVEVHFGGEVKETVTGSDGMYSVEFITTNVRDLDGLPSGFALGNNYPNPFNPGTQIDFRTPVDEMFTVQVYNVLGQRLYHSSHYLSAGIHTFTIDGIGTSGVYFFSISGGGFTRSESMIRLDGEGPHNIKIGVYSTGGGDSSTAAKTGKNTGEAQIFIKAEHHEAWDTTFVPGEYNSVSTELEQIIYELESQANINTLSGESVLHEARVDLYNHDNNDFIDSTWTDEHGIANINYTVPSVISQRNERIPLVERVRFEASKQGYEAASIIKDFASNIDIAFSLDPTRSATQNVELQDYVNIYYELRLDNVEEATINILKNENIILSKTVNEPEFSKIYTYEDNSDITKGDYAFQATWINNAGRDTTITKTLEIPDYPITIDLDGARSDVDEGKQIEIDLTGRLDKRNPEDHPITFAGATPLDDNTAVDVDGNRIIINARDNVIKDETYRIELKATSSNNHEVSKIMGGTVHNLLDLLLYIEDVEQKERQPSTVWVYDQNKNRLAEIHTPNGVIQERLPYRISDLTRNMYLQARARDQSGDQSYIRTIQLKTEDIEKLLRVAPYRGLQEKGISIEDNKRFVAELLVADPAKPGGDPLNWNPDILKWEPGTLEQIIISRQSIDDDRFLTQEMAEQYIRDRLLDKNDIGIALPPGINKDMIIIVDDYGQWELPRDNNKMIIYPTGQVSGVSMLFSRDGYAYFNRIRIAANPRGELYDLYTLPHEVMHGVGFRGHTFIESLTKNGKTIMGIAGGWAASPRYQPIDEKALRALNDDTYLHGKGAGGPNARLKHHDIMGLKLLDE